MIDAEKIKAAFGQLQAEIMHTLQKTDPAAHALADEWRHTGGGGGRSCVITGGDLIEKGGVNFSHVTGRELPPSATRRRPELAGRPFTAMGVSIVFHPCNPHVPCTHFNVRFFLTTDTAGTSPVWWFGGGMDLTPVYPVIEDVLSWHQAARSACEPFGAELYPRFKAACDQYFFLPHRNETRGIGGIFFDDFNQPDFPTAFAFAQSISNAFLPAWLTIAGRRRNDAFSAQQRAFQCYRRGRYAEFNLLYDRGTLFGLQSGGRTESILMSLPPVAHWVYQFTPAADSSEASLASDFLRPRDWLTEFKHLLT